MAEELTIDETLESELIACDRAAMKLTRGDEESSKSGDSLETQFLDMLQRRHPNVTRVMTLLSDRTLGQPGFVTYVLHRRIMDVLSKPQAAPEKKTEDPVIVTETPMNPAVTLKGDSDPPGGSGEYTPLPL